ncbi:transposase [Tepidanaerobacter acetatoxydans Re1]|jgi:transposase|uniref:Transposase n=1 Tax=Tepidanaerobacter acetatoxydans (strain DSM 21804 / JCM 16047 / Re1) TaxID=1209989 RepID=F4LT84_TEPAE|nr:transposase IS3/IS911 family protein [Tepidanaerobacter acetatoxydans Re1]CCP27417.1 transposase [Tepidanaerobacter acetatoxydans Re1]
MTRKQYTEEFKEQIIKECQEVGNVALVARRHDISSNTIHNWIRKAQKRGSITPLPKSEEKRIREVENRLEAISKENNTLKKLLGEKELELAVLRDLRDRINPQ